MGRSRSKAAAITGVMALVGSLSIASACRDSSEAPADVSAAKVKEETREAVEAAENDAADQRRQLTQQATRTAADVERELVDAREKLAELPGEARDRVEAAIARAERARSALRSELAELQKASEDRWEVAQARLSNALDELAEARREVAAALAGEKTQPERAS